jgi:glycosyltransferase involved in cell wall biosynthesis
MYKENINTEEIEDGETHLESLIIQCSDKRFDKVISVIIPVYQEEKILESTINFYTSEFKQKHNLEVIVSDGGSEDRTVEIAKKFADKVVIHNDSRRQTISEGRNKGAEVAEGRILVFINGDTLPAKPDYFFNFITNWANSDKIEFQQALACRVSMKPEDLLFKDRIFYTLHNFYVKFLNFIGLGMARGECQIMTKSIFNDVFGYNPLIAAGEDFELYSRIAKKSKIKYFDNLVVYESPRRFRKYGYIKVLLSWILNSLAVMFFGKSLSKDWEAVR